MASCTSRMLREQHQRRGSYPVCPSKSHRVRGNEENRLGLGARITRAAPCFSDEMAFFEVFKQSCIYVYIIRSHPDTEAPPPIGHPLLYPGIYDLVRKVTHTEVPQGYLMPSDTARPKNPAIVIRIVLQSIYQSSEARFLAAGSVFSGVLWSVYSATVGVLCIFTDSFSSPPSSNAM